MAYSPIRNAVQSSKLANMARAKIPQDPYSRGRQNDNAISSNQQTKPQYDPNSTQNAVGNNYNQLLKGKNAAADQAERMTTSSMDATRAQTQSSFESDAAQMGLKPGSPGYNAYKARQMSGTASAQSGILAKLAQDRMTDQRQTLGEAANFSSDARNYNEDVRRNDRNFTEDQSRDTRNFGEDKFRDNRNFSEDTRRYDTNRGDNIQTQDNENMKYLINNSDKFSVGQVGAAKNSFGNTTGLSGNNTWNDKDPTSVDNYTQELIDMNYTPEEARKMAIERFQNLETNNYNSLLQLHEQDMPSNAESGGGGGGGTDWGQTAYDLGNIGTLGNGSILKGATHTGMEMGRGVRDIANGDVLGGTGRIVAAPFKGVGHTVADGGRSVKRTYSKLKSLF